MITFSSCFLYICTTTGNFWHQFSFIYVHKMLHIMSMRLCTNWIFTMLSRCKTCLAHNMCTQQFSLWKFFSHCLAFLIICLSYDHYIWSWFEAVISEQYISAQHSDFRAVKNSIGLKQCIPEYYNNCGKIQEACNLNASSKLFHCLFCKILMIILLLFVRSISIYWAHEK